MIQLNSALAHALIMLSSLLILLVGRVTFRELVDMW